MKAYVQGQIQTLVRIGGTYGATAVAAGTAAGAFAAAPVVVPATVGAGQAVACYVGETVVATSPVWSNPSVQQSVVDFTTSLFPGAPAPNLPGFVGAVLGTATSPHEVAR